MKLFNRVGFSTPTIGTGNLAIGAAIRSATDGDYLTPAEAGAVNGDQSPYFIVDGHSFAQGLGTYSSTGPTLVRDGDERNWNGTTEAAGKLALSGNAVVFVSPRAVDLLMISAKLFFDFATGRFGIGTNAPASALHVAGSSPALTIQDDDVGSKFEIQDVSGGQGRVRKTTATGASTLDIEALAADGVSAAVVRLFRTTSTGALVALEICKGNNTSTVNARISGSGASFVVADNGNFGVGEMFADYKLDVNGSFGFTPGADVVPVDNGDVTIDTPANGSVRVRHKGSDGTVRAFTMPLGETPVTLGAAQALTSKELTTPLISNASPTAGGQIGRSGGNPQFHDGVAVRLFVTDANTVTMANKTLTAPILTDPKTRSTVRTVTGTTDTPVLADEGKRVELNNAAAITLTVPTNASVAYPVGTQIDLMQIGAGQVTVVGASGVTINGTPGLKLRAQWSAATLIKRGTDTWVLVGDLSA